MIDIDDDALARAAKELGTSTKNADEWRRCSTTLTRSEWAGHRRRGRDAWRATMTEGFAQGRLHLVDTSAFARVGHRRVRDVLSALVVDHAAATCVTVDLEAGYSGRRGHHRAAGVIDLLTAAVAEHRGATVLHYDANFEHIAATTGQAHLWVSPRGSLI